MANLIVILILANFLFIALNDSPLEATLHIVRWTLDTVRVTTRYLFSVVKASFIFVYDNSIQQMKLWRPPGLSSYWPNFVRLIEGLIEMNVAFKRLFVSICDYLLLNPIKVPQSADFYSTPTYDWEEVKRSICGDRADVDCLSMLATHIDEIELKKEFTLLPLEKLTRQELDEFLKLAYSVADLKHFKLAHGLLESAGMGLTETALSWFSYSWSMTREAWNRLMHSITGNTSRSQKKNNQSKDIRHQLQLQEQIEVDAAMRQFDTEVDRLSRMSLQQLARDEQLDIFDLKPNEIVNTLTKRFDAIAKGFQISGQPKANSRIKRAVRSVMLRHFKPDNGRWICAFCLRPDCKFDVVHISSEKTYTAAEVRALSTMDYSKFDDNDRIVRPISQVPTSSSSPSSSVPSGPTSPSVTNSSSNFPSPKPGVPFQDVGPISIPNKDLLLNLLTCTHFDAILECVRCTYSDSRGDVYIRLQALIRKLNPNLTANDALKLADSLLNTATRNEDPYVGPPLPRISTVDIPDIAIAEDDGTMAFELGLKKLYESQNILFGSKIPCMHCHTLHPHLCLKLLKSVSHQEWCRHPRFESLLKKHGDLSIGPLKSRDFEAFSSWVWASDRKMLVYNALFRSTDYTRFTFTDRPIFAEILPTGRRQEVIEAQVDEDLDRSLDPSFHKNPDIFEVQITWSRFGFRSSRNCWISMALLLEFLGRSNSSLMRIRDCTSFESHMNAINRTSDNIRIPTEYNMRYPNLIADSMLVATYKSLARADDLGIQVNRGDDPYTRSYTAMAGRCGIYFHFIVKLILLLFSLYVVVGLLVAESPDSPSVGAWPPVSTFIAETVPYPDPTSTTGSNQQEVLSIVRAANLLIQERQTSEN